MDQNYNQGHRNRVRDKFLVHGLESFAPHEILELILFYAIPRQNVNILAHKLISTFGSLSAVFDADYNDLMKVPGLGRSSVTLLKMIPVIARKYFSDSMKSGTTVHDFTDAGILFSRHFFGVTTEMTLLMLLDYQGKLITVDKISEGTFDIVNINLRDIASCALKYPAVYAYLAHNHMSSSILPSSDDIVSTKKIYELLGMLNVHLLDHIIVSKDDYLSLKQIGLFPEDSKALGE